MSRSLPKIAIVDYGAGNLKSIANAFEAIGILGTVVTRPEELQKADAIVLPGVGAFADGFLNLSKKKFIEELNRQVIENKKPYLGICLGLQFLMEKSFENGCHEGLGWVKGVVKKIQPRDNTFKIPHMGWNNSKVQKEGGLFLELGCEPVFYFVHSYCVEVDQEQSNSITSVCWHGQEIVASLQKENIFGVQFHPEKSQGAGLKLLKNFTELIV
jgi:glutamine amidotransferase